MIRHLRVVEPSGQQVQLIVDEKIGQDCHIIARESLKHNGDIILFDLQVAITANQGPIGVKIQPVDKGHWLSKDIYERHKALEEALAAYPRYIPGVLGHTDNTSTSEEEGVIMNDNPFKVFKKEVAASIDFLGIKIAIGSLHPFIVHILQLPISTQVGYFTIMAIFDGVLGILPPVRKKTKSTVLAVALNRFYQFCGSIAGLIALLAMQSALSTPNAQAGGVFGSIALHLFPLGVGIIGTIYGCRILGSFYRLAYGNKAKSAKGAFVDLLPDEGKWGKVKKLLKNDTISG